MIKVTKGPQLETPKPDGVVLDVSLRVLTDYAIETDSQVTRIDVLLEGNRQYNVSIVGDASACDPEFFKGKPIKGTQDLMLPAVFRRDGKGTVSRVNGRQLVEALRGLADVVERELG